MVLHTFQSDFLRPQVQEPVGLGLCLVRMAPILTSVMTPGAMVTLLGPCLRAQCPAEVTSWSSAAGTAERAPPVGGGWRQAAGTTMSEEP